MTNIAKSTLLAAPRGTEAPGRARRAAGAVRGCSEGRSAQIDDADVRSHGRVRSCALPRACGVPRPPPAIRRTSGALKESSAPCARARGCRGHDVRDSSRICGCGGRGARWRALGTAAEGAGGRGRSAGRASSGALFEGGNRIRQKSGMVQVFARERSSFAPAMLRRDPRNIWSRPRLAAARFAGEIQSQSAHVGARQRRPPRAPKCTQSGSRGIEMEFCTIAWLPEAQPGDCKLKSQSAKVLGFCDSNSKSCAAKPSRLWNWSKGSSDTRLTAQGSSDTT